GANKRLRGQSAMPGTSCSLQALRCDREAISMNTIAMNTRDLPLNTWMVVEQGAAGYDVTLVSRHSSQEEAEAERDRRNRALPSAARRSGTTSFRSSIRLPPGSL